MGKKEFDLTSLLSGVSSLDTGTGKKQIEYIDIERIHPDPNNFYKLDGIEELAANIELLGLQQPILVRKVDDGYMIVSGHRRTAAIRKLVEDGREDLRQVPCIVEAAASSPELQELRLIYANSDTRVMSPAEQWRQAERIGELLSELKEQGVEFKGRMRDHVAEICKVSKSKLARLKVIDDKLKPEGLRRAYEEGRLNETCAYEIAKRSEGAQELAAEQLNYILSRSAEEIGGIMDGLERTAEESRKVVRSVAAPLGNFSAEEYLAQRASEDRDYFSVLQAFAKQFAEQLPQMGVSRKENIDVLKRSLHYSGGGGSTASYDAYGSKGLTLRSYARDIAETTRSWTDAYDMLAAIAINELGKQPEPKIVPVPAAAPVPSVDTRPEWREGLPKKDGAYYGKFVRDGGEPFGLIAEYDRLSCEFYFPFSGEKVEAECIGWWPVPAFEDEPDEEENYE